MKKTLDYLDEAKNAKGIKSDNAFALSIGITRASMSSYKLNKTIMDDYTCIQIAGILGINPMEVIAAANYEREKAGDKKEFWLNFMMQYTRSTAAGVILLITFVSCFTWSEPARAENGKKPTSNYSLLLLSEIFKALSRRLKKLLQVKNPLSAGFFTPLCLDQIIS